MNTLQARRANFFRGTKAAALPNGADASLRMASDVHGSGTIAEREKSELVERHLTAFEATLPPNALSSGDRDKIRARAMLGSSSPSAILASVMQAIGEIKPALSQTAVNYHSSAAGPDAKSLDGLSGSGYRGGDPAFLRAMYGRDASRERSSDGGLGGLTRVGSSSFGVGSDGSLSGMSNQFYRHNFQSYYGASPQGQFTASRVAGILGKNEGLSSEALVARTKEVATDTRQRLGLDTNIYAPKVANIGKKYSDPIIANKANLDQARAAQKRGDITAQEQDERRFLDERKRQQERALREDPSKAGDVAGVYNGLIVEAMRNGWKPTAKNEAEFFRDVITSPDPEAKKRLDEMLEAAKKSPEGAAMVQRVQPAIDEARRTAERREADQRTAATKEQAAVAADAANFGDLDAPPAKAPDAKPAAEDQPAAPAAAGAINPTAAPPAASGSGEPAAKAPPPKPPAPK